MTQKMRLVMATIFAAATLIACGDGEMTAIDVGHCYAYNTTVKKDAGTADAVNKSFTSAITKVSVSEALDQGKLWIYAYSFANSPDAKAELVAKAKKSCSKAKMPH